MTVKELRAKTGLSQSKFAARFGIPVRTLQEWEQGRQVPPPYVVGMIQEILEPENRQEGATNMGNITIKAPKGIDCDVKEWPARYDYWGMEDARLIRIESRSAIDVVVAKIAENGLLGVQTNYYISTPNFGVAIPSIPSLLETYWITEKLMAGGMPAPDSVTVAQVLREIGDF